MVISKQLREIAKQLEDIAMELDSQAYHTVKPAWIDLRKDLPYNPDPDHQQFPQGEHDWATVTEKTGITIHHIGIEGATVQGTAAWTTRSIYQGGKGLPRLQYHFWVGRDGTVYYCTDLKYGQWHDHQGYPNSHIAVALEGRLDITPPTEVQLTMAGRLIAWLMSEYALSIDVVRGHSDYYKGICPGWTEWRLSLMESVQTFSIIPDFSIMGVPVQEIHDDLGKE